VFSADLEFVDIVEVVGSNPIPATLYKCFHTSELRQSALSRFVCFLRSLVQTRRSPSHKERRPVVLLNITISERHASEDRKTKTADRKIQHRLRDEFGLINCWQESNAGQPLAQTLRWGSDKSVPYHCDGLFVPATWRASLKSCKVISGNKWDDLSDHNPVVAEFK